MRKSRPGLPDLLSGGDLRSTGAADRTAAQLLSGTWTAGQLLALIESAAPVVRMRAADALEKASRTSPALLRRASGRLLRLLRSDQPREIRWHLLQMAPRIRWTQRQRGPLLRAVQGAFGDPSAIVQTSALQALAELSRQGPAFAAAYRRRLAQASASTLPSLRSRARRLSRHNAS